MSKCLKFMMKSVMETCEMMYDKGDGQSMCRQVFLEAGYLNAGSKEKPGEVTVGLGQTRMEGGSILINRREDQYMKSGDSGTAGNSKQVNITRQEFVCGEHGRSEGSLMGIDCKRRIGVRNMKSEIKKQRLNYEQLISQAKEFDPEGKQKNLHCTV